jgi:hypothetical protein
LWSSTRADRTPRCPAPPRYRHSSPVACTGADARARRPPPSRTSHLRHNPQLSGSDRRRRPSLPETSRPRSPTASRRRHIPISAGPAAPWCAGRWPGTPRAMNERVGRARPAPGPCSAPPAAEVFAASPPCAVRSVARAAVLVRGFRCRRRCKRSRTSRRQAAGRAIAWRSRVLSCPHAIVGNQGTACGGPKRGSSRLQHDLDSPVDDV